MYSQNKTTLKAKEREKKKHTKRPDEKTLTFLNKVGLNGILFSTDTKTIQKKNHCAYFHLLSSF